MAIQYLLKGQNPNIILLSQVSCCFWLPAQGINFAFVPQTFRVVYIAAASFLWVNILSICKSKGIDIVGMINGALGLDKKEK